MRKIILSNFISLDGFFEGPNKELDWMVVEGEFVEYVRELLNGVDTILLGRTTYQLMAKYWPDAKDNDATITHMMNHLHKIIFSKTLKKVEWNNAVLATTHLSKEVEKLKEQAGKDMVVLGSGTLVTQLTQWGLIDEYRLIIPPVILGKGNPLFKGIDDKMDLKLLQTKALKSGVVILYYEPKKTVGY